MFGYRTGDYPVTAKALRKLQAAETDAGIVSQAPQRALQEVSESGENQSKPALREPGEPSIPERLARMEAQLAETLAAMASMRKALDELMSLFTSRKDQT